MIPRDQDPIDVIQQLWVEVASILKATNDDMFPSKDATAKMIQNGEYMRHLQRIQPVLRSWQRKFEQSNGGISAASNAKIPLTEHSENVSEIGIVDRISLLSLVNV